MAPETTIRLDRMIPLEVVLVDARSGAVLAEGRARLPKSTAARTTYGSTERELLVTPLHSGLYAEFALELETPRGTLARNGLRAFVECSVSAFARRARLRVPVWPELNLRVVLPDAALTLDVCWLGESRFVGAVVHAQSESTVQVRGVPAIPGAALHLVFSKPSNNVGFAGTIDEQGRCFLTRMDEASWTNLRKSEMSECEEHEEFEDVGWLGALPEGGASFAVRVLLRDGSPAGGIRVYLDSDSVRAGRADGVAVFEHCLPGEHQLNVWDPAWGHFLRKVKLVDGRRTELLCHAPRTRRIRVEVVGADGRGIPAVRVDGTCSGRPVVPSLDAGTQELVALTDSNGHLDWPWFPEGQTRFVATHGTRSASASARPRGPDTVRIVLGERVLK